MKSAAESFLVQDGKKTELKDFDPGYTGAYDTKKSAREDACEALKELRKHQDKLFAGRTHSVLIILQAMDCAGKDGMIRHLCSGISGQGVKVNSFGKPDVSDYNYNFLKRYGAVLPARGMIGIFNRSYYEHTLICKVHPEYVLEERIPGIDKPEEVNKEFWEQRYGHIRDFEKMLADNGTVLLKFFLHLSKAEQRERLLKRIDDPDKQWKFSYDDIEEREHWAEYQKAYEDALEATSTKYAPWYVIPADHKWYSRLAVTSILNERLKELGLRYPRLNDHQKRVLEKAASELGDK